jgi:uncharacterized membrane protein
MTKGHKVKMCRDNVHYCIKHIDTYYRGRDRMVVGFTTTYVISAYHY